MSGAGESEMAKEEGRPASVDNQQDQRHQGLKATVKKKKSYSTHPATCALRPAAADSSLPRAERRLL